MTYLNCAVINYIHSSGQVSSQLQKICVRPYDPVKDLGILTLVFFLSTGMLWFSSSKDQQFDEKGSNFPEVWSKGFKLTRSLIKRV